MGCNSLKNTLTRNNSPSFKGEAATIIDNFDDHYDDESQTIDSFWYAYSDKDDNPESKTVFTYTRDTEIKYNGTASLRVDFNVPDPDKSYAGIAMEFDTAKDWTASYGILAHVKANKPGLKVIFVLLFDDPSQTFADSFGQTPFEYRYTITEDNIDSFQEVFIAWDKLIKAEWIGKSGMNKPDFSHVIGLEIIPESAQSGTYWIDDIRLAGNTDINAAAASELVHIDVSPIKINNVGYRPNDIKCVYITKNAPSFSVKKGGKEVFTDKFISAGIDADAGEEVFVGNFSGLTEPGKYTIEIKGIGTSQEFTISDNVYQSVVETVMNGMLFWRSGQSVHQSGIQYNIGHPSDAHCIIYNSDTTIDVFGGWYDAGGEFGKYVPTGAFSADLLLLTYQLYPDKFTDKQSTIPEAGNGIADILDEARWELEFLLKMQKDNGSFRHKVSEVTFGNFRTPDTDTTQRYVYGISSQATADATAVLAHAAYIFNDVDNEFATKCLSAAENGWDWLIQHPDNIKFRNPNEVQTRRYNIDNDSACRLWAAINLYSATEARMYHDYIDKNFNKPNYPELDIIDIGWDEPYIIALVEYLLLPTADDKLSSKIQSRLNKQAKRIMKFKETPGYHVVIHGNNGYGWGTSNGIVLGRLLTLSLSGRLLGEAEYNTYALSQINYILGANTLNKTYITGVGTNPVMQPHHHASIIAQTPAPGLIVAGPAGPRQGADQRIKSLWRAYLPVAKCYVDGWKAYTTNEPTIDNSALFILAIASFI